MNSFFSKFDLGKREAVLLCNVYVMPCCDRCQGRQTGGGGGWVSTPPPEFWMGG